MSVSFVRRFQSILKKEGIDVQRLIDCILVGCWKLKERKLQYKWIVCKELYTTFYTGRKLEITAVILITKNYVKK